MILINDAVGALGLRRILKLRLSNYMQGLELIMHLSLNLLLYIV
jgi:hypothetical protein